MLATISDAYKPIIAIHGMNGSYRDFDELIDELSTYQPGHRVFALDVDNKIASMKKVQTLVDDAAELIDKIIAKEPDLFRDGFILLGHSQGALVGRALVQQRGYNVTRFISLAGIQNGFYGHCGFWILENLTCSSASAVMYTKALQATLSIAGYWRSPNRAQYLKGNLFLPILNNEEGVTTTPAYQKMQKENFLRVGEYHFFGSPADSSITPWFTSLFDTLGTDGESRVPLKDQYIYKHDTFGLRTAVEQGRAHFYEIPYIKHVDWLDGDTDLFERYLFPLLD